MAYNSRSTATYLYNRKEKENITSQDTGFSFQARKVFCGGVNNGAHC